MSTSTTKLGLTKPAAGENYSRSVLNNNADIIDNYAINTIEKLPKGLLHINEVTANGGAITSLSIINNFSTFTFKANRWYELAWEGSYYTSVNNAYYATTICTCSTADAAASTTGLTQLGGKNNVQPVATNTAGFRVAVRKKWTVDTTLQVKFAGQLVYGGGNGVVLGSPDNPVQYYILDLGQNY